MGRDVTFATCDGPRPVVLVIEDDSSVREALGLILEDRYEVVFAADGPPALDLMRTGCPDMVLLDLGLPTMNGFDVLTGLKTIAPAVPVVIVTVTTATDKVVRAMRLGASDYVTKPFDENVLLARVSAAFTTASSEPRPPSEVWGLRDATPAWPLGRPAPTPVPRRRCLVMAGHAGTASTLGLVLDRYVATDVTTDGISAFHALGTAVPDCVLADEHAWAAGGAAFVRVLRAKHPASHVVLITDRPDLTGPLGDRATLADALVPQQSGLGEILRRTLTLCARAPLAEIADLSLSPYLLAALDYLRLSYAEEVTSDTVARAAGVSRAHLAERFRAELGLTPRQYLTRLRIEVAKTLLWGRHAKLDEVAALAGFRDPSHLSRVFRIATGYRPGAYRRRFSRPGAGPMSPLN